VGGENYSSLRFDSKKDPQTMNQKPEKARILGFGVVTPKKKRKTEVLTAATVPRDETLRKARSKRGRPSGKVPRVVRQTQVKRRASGRDTGKNRDGKLSTQDRAENKMLKKHYQGRSRTKSVKGVFVLDRERKKGGAKEQVESWGEEPGGGGTQYRKSKVA